MNILDKIVARKKEELTSAKAKTSVKELEQSLYFNRETFSLKDFLLDPSKTGIIAEFKRKSPSKGIINDGVTVEEVQTKTEGKLLVEGEKREREYNRLATNKSADRDDVKAARSAFLDIYESVMTQVIDLQPDLLFKKILIFITNVVNQHWVIIFVFNTDCIQLAEPNDVGSDRERRCCFF